MLFINLLGDHQCWLYSFHYYHLIISDFIRIITIAFRNVFDISCDHLLKCCLIYYPEVHLLSLTSFPVMILNFLRFSSIMISHCLVISSHCILHGSVKSPFLLVQMIFYDYLMCCHILISLCHTDLVFSALSFFVRLMRSTFFNL